MSEVASEFSIDWAYAYGEPQVEGLFRRQLDDFIVDENLGFELEGSGEHVYLHIEKRGDNTAWLARQIARLADVQPMDVGYAGLKDRHGVTRQWFSVYFPKGEEPTWADINSETVTLLSVCRHNKKLRRGSHASNSFCIRLHELKGDFEGLDERLKTVAQQGVPNYFGQQRFGHDGNNLQEAQRLLVDGGKIKNRQKRGLILSAARSYLFNRVLSARVANDSWLSLFEGEPSLPSVSSDQSSALLPTGPLWGRGRPLSSGECEAFESAELSSLESWKEGLEHVGLSQERRLLSLIPEDFCSILEQGSLEVKFSLPPGTYATAILRELLVLKDVSLQQDMV